MASALKVGVAGLGTVGAALVAQVTRQREALAARCGRAIEIVAVCARSRSKSRGVDLRKLKWFSDPVALAREPGIDVFVELVGGDGDPAKSAVEEALAQLRRSAVGFGVHRWRIGADAAVGCRSVRRVVLLCAACSTSLGFW